MKGVDVDLESDNVQFFKTRKQTMFCWGNCANGTLGLGTIEEECVITPREVRSVNGKNVRTISCGTSHTLVVLQNGELYSCGNNDYGQLGHKKSKTEFQHVNNLSSYKIVAASCGDSHSLALDQWGQLFSWGLNSHGQLGLNIEEPQIEKPKLIKFLGTSVIVQIACGYKHCLALTNKGELFAWGSNDNGQLGLGLKTQSVNTPSLVSTIIGLPISLIACGSSHSFILSKSGAVYGWGKNRSGQLGLNSEVDHIYPCQLKTLRSIKVKFIDCGEDFSAFLTQDGGVLTCGAGKYGQLGHQSDSNEVLPRKIVELMGSTVTQISCGRRHTLVFLPSGEEVYAFGLGITGQLGTNRLENFTTPQVVQGPWRNAKKNLHVESLFSGGDHSFAIASTKKISADYRVLRPEINILLITYNKMVECEKTPEDRAVSQELLAYLETVFSSQACINGSFLLERESHYCSSSRNHGLDLEIARVCFTTLSRTNNVTIKEVCLEAIAGLLPQLPESPPDVETLRIYLVLPWYHEFLNSRHASKIQGPFAAAILKLKAEAAKIVGNWYRVAPEEYFERLVQIYKNVILFLLKNQQHNENRENWDLNHCDVRIIDSLEFLSQLNKINKSKTNSVNYEIFCLQELLDLVDIRVDYIKWANNDFNMRATRKYLCDYPFLFNAQAKTLLLETDQSMQMHTAMSNAARLILTHVLFTPGIHTVNATLDLTVTRQNIVQDTMTELRNCSEVDYKKPLKVKFIGEEAEDAGGVKKEFFLLLLREILDPKYGMFKSEQETRAIWFSEDTFEDEVMFYLVGLICGLAIYNFIIINLPFPLALYKKLLGEPVDIQDLKEFSPTLANGLQELLNYNGNNFDDIFPLTFEVTRDVYGALKTVELKKNGKDTPVTMENREEYVKLYVDYILNESVKKHYEAFHGAFHKVCGGRVLQLFHAQELMAVVIGNENYDWNALQNGTEYRGGYSSADKTIQLFWEVFHELPLQEKKKFLLFLTGSDRIPIQGMKAIKIIIQPTTDERFLPVAHTCFNILDLPRYSTKERLRYKLTQAIQQTQGFSIV